LRWFWHCGNRECRAFRQDAEVHLEVNVAESETFESDESIASDTMIIRAVLADNRTASYCAGPSKVCCPKCGKWSKASEIGSDKFSWRCMNELCELCSRSFVTVSPMTVELEEVK
jgi:hypothetical protein